MDQTARPPCRTTLGGGTLSAPQTLDCDGNDMDRWELNLAAGVDVTLTVDTVTPGTNFDPAMFVVGPDGCADMTADDEADCTWPVPVYGCPVLGFTSDSAGVYDVYVQNLGRCAGIIARYTLASDVGTPTLVGDNIDAWSVDITETLTITGSATG